MSLALIQSHLSLSRCFGSSPSLVRRFPFMRYLARNRLSKRVFWLLALQPLAAET